MTRAAKTTEPAEQMSAAYRAMMDYTVNANRVMAAGFERALQEQLEVLEAAVDSLRPLTGVKQPAELMEVQMAAAKGLNERAAAAMANLLKIQQETGAELRQVATDGMKAVSAHLPKAA